MFVYLAIREAGRRAWREIPRARHAAFNAKQGQARQSLIISGSDSATPRQLLALGPAPLALVKEAMASLVAKTLATSDGCEIASRQCPANVHFSFSG
jgi:hypothetical protein